MIRRRKSLAVPFAFLALALVLFAAGGIEPLRAERTRGSVTLTRVEPPQLVAGEPGELRLEGEDLVTYCIAGVRLLDQDRLTAAETLDVTVHSETELTARFGALPQPGLYQIHVINAAGRTRSRSAGNLFLTTFERPPGVATILPGTMDTHAGGALAITGSNLSAATQVVLVDGERLVPLEVLSATASSVATNVPKGVVPGRYRVRVVTKDGISLLGPRLRITDSSATGAIAAALVPDTLATGAGGAIEVRGSGLANVTSLVLVASSGARTTIAATGDDASRAAAVPAGLAEGFYDVRLSTPSGEVAAPRLQLAVADPATPPLCFEFRKIGSTGIQVESAGLVARFSRGILVYVRDAREDAAALVRSLVGLPPGAGISFDDNTIPEASAGGSASLLGIDFAGDAAGCTATHRFSHAATGATFRITVDTRPAAITLRIAFDSAVEIVNGARYDIAGLDPDFDLTFPAFGGCKFDRSHILAAGGIVVPAVHTHHGLVLLEGDAGRVRIDATPFVLRTESYFALAYRDATRAIDMTLDGKTRKNSLHSGEPLVFELSAPSEPFDAVYAAERGDFANPAPPGAKRPFAMVLELANQYVASADAARAAAAEVKRFELDRGTRFPRDRVLVFHLGWSVNETNTAYPDYDEPVDVSFFEPALGAVQMPYLSAVAAHEGTPHIEKLRDVLLTRFDRASGLVLPVIWDEDLSGAFDDVHDHYYANCSAPAFRDLFEAQVADLQEEVEERTGRRLEGFYLDLAAAVVRDDRNPATGDHVAGLIELASRSRALTQDPSTAPIAGEGLSPHTARAGITHSARGLLFDDAKGLRERPALKPGSRPHPAVTVLVGAESRGYSHFAAGGAASDPVVAYGARWIGYFQGLIPTTLLGLNNQARTAWQSDTGRRATEIELEEGAYAGAHGVETWFEPDPLWSAPGTAVVVSVDGVPVARSREFYRDKVILDAFWHFGGTVPSPALFAKARAVIAPNLVDVMAAVSQLRYAFTRNPTPAGSILTRAEALRRIRDDLGFAYPAP